MATMNCPKCQAKLKYGDAQMGKTIPCPACENPVSVPTNLFGIVVSEGPPSTFVKAVPTARVNVELDERVERLARGNRWLCVACVLGPVLAIVVSRATTPTPPPAPVATIPKLPIDDEGILSVRGIVIRDRKGDPGITIGYENARDVGITIYDNGLQRTAIKVVKGRAIFGHFYANGQLSGVFSGGNDLEESPLFSLFDREGNPRVASSIENGMARQVFYGDDKRVVSVIGVDAAGLPIAGFRSRFDVVHSLLDADGDPAPAPAVRRQPK